MATLGHVSSLFPHTLKPRFSRPQLVKHSSSFNVGHRLVLHERQCSPVSRFFKPPNFRIRSLESDNDEAAEESNDDDDDLLGSVKISETGTETSFLAKIAIALGIATTVTLVSICIKRPSLGSSNGLQFLPQSASSLAMGAAPVGFTFKCFGYSVVIPEYAPGWIYFWLLMAAGFGLFISEEALNIWVCPLLWLACLWLGGYVWMAPGSRLLNISREMLLTLYLQHFGCTGECALAI